MCPPTFSPDMNILDIGLFNLIQVIPNDFIDFIKVYIKPNLLNYTWIQYQLCILEMLKVRGGNNIRTLTFENKY